MADIDKGLPNTRTKVEVPGEEVEIKEEIKEQLPVEVTPEEDGGATIDFEPGAINIPGTESHFDNLADILPEDVLEPLGTEMKTNYLDYKMSRKDWERSYTEGLDLLGFKYENRTEPFQGFRCNAPSVGRSCYTVPSHSIQRAITSRRSSKNTDTWKPYACKRTTSAAC